MMKRIWVIVIVCLCGMAFVSCKPNPPKEAKAKELVETHFKEKGYAVKCVTLGAYSQLGEGRWSAEVEVKRDDDEQMFTYEVEFKALKKGYELSCGFEYMLELDDLVKRKVNENINKNQFKILSIGKVPQKTDGAVNKDVKPFSLGVEVKYMLFDPSRIPEGDVSAQPKKEARGEIGFSPEITQLQTRLFNKDMLLLGVLEECIKEQIVNEFMEEYFITVTVDAFQSLYENGKNGYSGKAKISNKKRKLSGLLSFDLVLVENGFCKVTCHKNGFEKWMVDEGKDAKWRKRRLEILAQAWKLAWDPEKLHDEEYHPLGNALVEMANNAIRNEYRSSFWGDYTKLKPEEKLNYMSSIITTQTISFEGQSFTKSMLGSEYGAISVNTLPPLPTLFDSSSLDSDKFPKVDLETWEKEIEMDIKRELEGKYDLRFMSDSDYLEKAYPIYQKLDKATVTVKEERGVKNVKIIGMVKAIGENKVMIGPRTILIEDLTEESRLSFDMNFREKKFKEIHFNDAMRLKLITQLRQPMHDRRLCIKLQEAGYLPNVFKAKTGLYNPDAETWVSQYDFLAHWLRAHLIAKDLLEKEGYVYSLNMKNRYEWMPKKCAENFATYLRVKNARLIHLGEVMRERRKELEKMRMDGYSDEAIERAIWREFGRTNQGDYGRCLFCKGTGMEVKYTGGGFYKKIECRACYGTGKTSNVDDVTLDASGNVVENTVEEFEDEEFWNTGTVVPVPLE